ncbi:MAG: asparagine synthetase B [Bacteriovoracia bacterium]
MCGFLGVFRANGKSPFGTGEISPFRAAFSTLAHRGNTSSGESISSQAALFHYRLAFRDLALGKQPLTDTRGRATIIFNGELYGFRPLRDELAKRYDFQTHSDTEVILAAYLELGENFLDYLDGEYAFVIHDHRDGRVVAARDPFGVKPLFLANPQGRGSDLFRAYKPFYEFNLGEDFAFASEIKGLPFPLAWDKRGHERAMLSLYEEMGTAYQNVIALAPGSLFSATSERGAWRCRIDRKIAKRRAQKATRLVSFADRAAELKKIIGQNVRNKLDAEVPLGAYLSGGIDSRIAALEMSRAGATIETFTVGFEGADYDETQEVSRFLKAYPNLRGRALRTNNEMLEYAYPHAIYASELVQPYTNGAAKWWLSRFARKYVRGVLTGDGADELFCGYPSYRYLAWWNFYRRQPTAARASLYEARVVGKSEKYWEKGLSSLPDGTDLEASVKSLGWAHPLFSQVQSLGNLLGNGPEILTRERSDIYSYVQADAGASPLTLWQNYFLHTHFPTHVLNWVGDRMEMANTLEGRPIYLSRTCLDFFDQLPDSYLVRGLTDKAILRKAYAAELGAFAATPKKQFNAPFLLDGPLGKEFLQTAALRETGLIDPGLVAAALKRRDETNNALERSFVEIFLQNCLVTQMLDRYLVRRNPPDRNLPYEESRLTERTVDL